jgi:hypothetical protein
MISIFTLDVQFRNTHADNHHQLLVEVLDLEQGRYEEDRDRCECLEHLNEGHAQSGQSAGVIWSSKSGSCSRQVGGVAQYERSREKDTNGNY